MTGVDRLGTVLALLAGAATAAAHDGGFGHSRRTLYVSAAPTGWLVEYRIAVERDEALVEMTRMDTDGDGQVSAKEADRYFAVRGRQIADRLQVRDGAGRPVTLVIVDYELGPALTQVYRFTAETTAFEVVLDDRNFPHKPGLVQIRTGPGVTAALAKPADLTHAERVSVRVKKERSK
jgi:hypothetical protein